MAKLYNKTISTKVETEKLSIYVTNLSQQE